MPFNLSGKPGYIYDQATDTWYQITGKSDTSASYEWAGTHEFLSSVEMVTTFLSQHGINNFLNPAARDAALTSPTAGTLCFLRQDAGGNTINQIQYYNGTSWSGQINPTTVPTKAEYDDFVIQSIMGVFND